jgi:hypothetical protein
MRKALIAEWILSLATTPERAAATVGDLLERPSGFRLSVLRTFASLVIDGLAASPLRVAGLALVGFVAQYILFLVFALHPRVLTLRMNESLNASWFLIVLIGCMFTRVLRERALAACFVLAILNIILTALVILERGRAGVNMPMLAIFQLPCFVGVVLSRRRHSHKHA